VFFFQQTGTLAAELADAGFHTFNKIILHGQTRSISRHRYHAWVGRSYSCLKVPGLNLVALCDVDKNVLDTTNGELSKMNVDASKLSI